MSQTRIGERAAPPAVVSAADVAPVKKAESAERAPEPSAFAQVFAHLIKESDQQHEAMKGALKANGVKALDSVSLLALQSNVYRYGQVVELTSKVAEQAVQSTQTVLKSGGQ